MMFDHLQSLNGKRTSRSVTRKRERTTDKLEQTMGELGVEVGWSFILFIFVFKFKKKLIFLM